MTPTVETRNSPELIPPRGHYSHVAVRNGVAYVSGQLPLGSDGTPLADASFDDQVRAVLRALDHCLVAAGTDRGNLLSVTVSVTDIERWPAFDTLYATWLGDHRPSRAVAAVHQLHFGVGVEVQAVATVPAAAGPEA